LSLKKVREPASEWYFLTTGEVIPVDGDAAALVLCPFR